jgi:predicted Zn-dependent protease
MNSKNTLILFITLLCTITATTLLIALNDKKFNYKPPIFVSQDDEHNRQIKVADAAFVAKSYKVALENYRKVLVHYPDNFPLLNRIGTIYLRLKNYSQAEKVFDSLVRRVPDEVAYLVNLSVAQLYLNKFDEALASAEQAQLQNADDIRVYVVMAGVAAQKNDPETAINQLKNINDKKYTIQFIKETIFNKIRDTEEFKEFSKELDITEAKENK